MNDGEKMLKMDEPINKERHRDERWREEREKEMDKVWAAHHKSVEYHSSNGSCYSPMMGDLIHSPTLD
jgi:hypothetical protein